MGVSKKPITRLIKVLLAVLTAVLLFDVYRFLTISKEVKRVKSDVAAVKAAAAQKKWADVKFAVLRTDFDLLELQKGIEGLVVFDKIGLAKEAVQDISSARSLIAESKDSLEIVTAMLSEGRSYLAWSPEERRSFWKKSEDLLNLLYQNSSLLLKHGLVSPKTAAMLKLASKFDTLLGYGGGREYLLLFQNNAELRPTGGFWGSFADVKVENGLISADQSYPIGEIKKDIDDTTAVPPDIRNIVETITGGALPVEFANSVSEFDLAVKAVLPLFEQRLSTNLQGAVAIDIFAVKDLLAAVGPVEMDTVGVVTKENFIQKLIYEPNYRSTSDGSEQKRKYLAGKIGVDLVNKLFSQGFVSAAEWFARSVADRHILFWDSDKKVQDIYSELGVSGGFDRSNPNFLHLEELNFGGKQSIYLERFLKVTKVGGDEFEVKLRYSYPRTPEALKLLLTQAKVLARVRTPEGSKLISASGGYQKSFNIVEVNGTAGFSNVILLNPGDEKELVVRYKAPRKAVESMLAGDLPKVSVQPGIIHLNIEK